VACRFRFGLAAFCGQKKADRFYRPACSISAVLLYQIVRFSAYVSSVIETKKKADRIPARLEIGCVAVV
jgi:hypothetical protein